MSKFKIGDKVRLKDDATNWAKEIYGREITVSSSEKISERSAMSSGWCVANYPDDFELVEDVSKRHVHHDMIVEWAKDPSRVVEYFDEDLLKWVDCADSEQECPIWDKNTKYRFKPVEPERTFHVTSLTVDELLETYEDTYTHREGLVAVANAAIKQYILDNQKK